MKLFITLTLMLTSLTTVAAELSDDPNTMLQQLVTCEVTWKKLNDDYWVTSKIEDFYGNHLTRERKKRSFLPKQEMNVFGINVVKVYPSVGLQPGFMVELDTSISNLLDVVVINGNKMLEDCNSDKTICGKKLSKTESVMALDERGRVFLACAYPYQK